MRCSEVRARLEAGLHSGDNPEGALLTHLRDCSECRNHAEELRLLRLLRTLPVPPSSPGLAGRALQRGWRMAAPARPLWRIAALAASLLLAAGLGGYWGWRQFSAPEAPAVQVVLMQPHQTRTVDVLMVSRIELPAAHITVHVDRGLMLAGYPGVDTLRWQAPIKAGNNRLSLPVQLRDGAAGNIVIQIESGQARRQLHVLVRPAEKPAAGRLMI